MSKPNDLPPEVQAAAILAATHVILTPPAAGLTTAVRAPGAAHIVKMAVEIMKEYAKVRDVGD